MPSTAIRPITSRLCVISALLLSPLPLHSTPLPRRVAFAFSFTCNPMRSRCVVCCAVMCSARLVSFLKHTHTIRSAHLRRRRIAHDSLCRLQALAISVNVLYMYTSISPRPVASHSAIASILHSHADSHSHSDPHIVYSTNSPILMNAPRDLHLLFSNGSLASGGRAASLRCLNRCLFASSQLRTRS